MGDSTRPVVLVSMDWIRDADERRSLGSASIVAALEAAGVRVRWIDRAVNERDFDAQELMTDIHEATRELGGDAIIGIGCYVWNEPIVQRLLQSLRDTHDIVLGGPQVSFVGAGLLDHLYPGARWFVRGYGEQAMVALATGSAVNGELGVYDTRDLDCGARFDGSLDALPSPWLDGVLSPTSVVRWETQRGCPFRCSFCQHREPNERHRARVFSGDRVMDELQLFKDHSVHRVSVLDPIFHLNRPRAIELLAAAQGGPHLSLQCRFEMVKPDLAHAFEAASVTLEFGLQTTEERVSKFIGRANRIDRVEPVLLDLLGRGIDLEVSLIYGLPGQTLAGFIASVRWCLQRGVPRVRAWPLMLLRGTPLYAERERWGFVESGGPIPEVVASSSHTRLENQVMREIAGWLGRNEGASDLPLHWRSLGRGT